MSLIEEVHAFLDRLYAQHPSTNQLGPQVRLCSSPSREPVCVNGMRRGRVTLGPGLPREREQRGRVPGIICAV